MPADPSRVRDLFLAAAELPPADRPAYLAGSCGADADLRAAVERLLAAHAAPSPVLDSPHAAAPDGPTGTFTPHAATAPAGGPAETDDHTPQPDAGTVLGGRYKLVEEVGEGGMGTVWMARQTEPVKRLVAVKLVKPGMDSRAVLARFDAERQALALMDHPNIAKVFDAGATPDGRPFFVMELVKGVPITRFCDDRKLTPRERLELFVPVCQAVQHAHQKGVIHRDLKPSNVLVALYDDRPVPKVIDFGVAKATGPALTDLTLVTGFGAVVGTPEYMSPEQASFNNLDVDTRSDVYALGVLLYELLTGGPPFRRADLERAGLMEIFRVIREQEPPRPSTRVSTAEALPTLAANRSTEPRKLTQLLRSELDWVVMKALEKDRNRRYDTAAGFAADVQRYLGGESVQAVPPSAGYRLRKFLRKNRGPVAAAGVVFLALVLGIVGTTTGLVRADRARRAAEAAEANERAERTRAETARREADDQRKKAEWQTASATIDLLDQIGDERSLLRAARLVRTLPPHAGELRQYLVVRLVADMQQYCPLAPQLEGTRPDPGEEWDGIHVTGTPDGRHLVGRTSDGEAGVWEVKTHRRVARLRDGDDALEDGPTLVPSVPGRAYTVSKSGDVRLWEVSTGRLLLRVAPRTDRGGSVDSRNVIGVWPSPRHLLIQSGHWRERWREPRAGRADSAFELWDIAGRRLVATWDDDVPLDYSMQVGDEELKTSYNLRNSVLFSPDGTNFLLRQTEAVQVRRTADGQLVKVLPHARTVDAVAFSPSGRRVITLADQRVHWWRTDTWDPDGPVTQCRHATELWQFPTDDLVILRKEGHNDPDRPVELVNWGSPVPLDIPVPPGAWTFAGGRLWGPRWVLDIDSRQLNHAPPEHRYHAAAAGLADDGRWLVWGDDIIDLAVGKPLTVDHPGGNGRWAWLTGFSNPVRMPGGGYVCWHNTAGVVYVPPSTIDIPPDVLELWVQLVLRCDLGPDDEVRRWDEPTWERKRQEFVARARPTPDFPFPGRLATDRLYWLRSEIEAVQWGDRLDDESLDLIRLAGQFDRLLAAEPSARGYYGRAALRVKLERWRGAADDYLAAHRLDTSRSRWNTLPNLGWSWVSGAGKPAERYHAAVRLAEVVRKEEPEDWQAARALGVGYYRTGRDREAVAVLREAHDRYRLAEQVRFVLGPGLISPWAAAAAKPPHPGDPAALAALAMAHHRLGERAEAHARLAELRALATATKATQDAGTRDWLREASEVVEGKTPGK